MLGRSLRRCGDFEEREKLMVFYERASGSAGCMPLTCVQVRCSSGPASRALIDDIATSSVNEHPQAFWTISKGLLTDNRIFKQRNVDIGVVSLQECLGLGLFRRHGARFRRCLGFAQGSALRMLQTNSISIFRLAKMATAIDRYLIRMEEMRQSVKIMLQCIEKLLNAARRTRPGFFH